MPIPFPPLNLSSMRWSLTCAGKRLLPLLLLHQVRHTTPLGLDVCSHVGCFPASHMNQPVVIVSPSVQDTGDIHRPPHTAPSHSSVVPVQCLRHLLLQFAATRKNTYNRGVWLLYSILLSRSRKAQRA